jgi:hypothetical protein
VACVPALEITDLIHTAVVWAVTGRDVDGMPIVSHSPTQIKCRWVGKQSVMLDKDGNTVAIDATVVVAQDVTLFSAIWMGQLATLPGTSPNEPPSNVMTVVIVNKTDDLKGRSTRRTLGVKRAKDSLPVTS